ncbi:extracellular solute-binding protein family 1 [Catenulispora acidiphila DSM 44928]|uniref:Extracellular solute-binding protein family 1 n=1 Tax=Catenulispora acidiphila (strain DSM 44928 / JCM 14897 / NBRC 102108 / NRRL B-24433 / ID139908) TaxID=479433 RepID=C7QAK1_CATAD|nr:extracellular solute-binding protein [Catenulispora acidiphila]ACU72500.1 extracellular solute-binding protein family 1 [Catenulispora acidiphila DSM 44928]
MKAQSIARRVAAAGLALAVTGAAGACSASKSSTGSAASGGGTSAAAGGGGGTFTVWDPYPQFDNGSAWSQLLTKCGSQAGVTVKRTGFDTTDLTTKVLLAAQQGNSPDVLIVDNPVVSTLADAGVITDTGTTHLDTTAIAPNLLAAGQLAGKTYGVPIGANTLALYYNKAVLSAAGVDISTVKDWSTLTAALAKVTAAGKKGITFSAIGTEEGSFQFLPWFWGSGADLKKLDSPQGVSALALWTDWLKKGYAPNSVINNTQTTSWQEFATGQYAFSENGTWQLANAKKAGFDYGIIPIPALNGGTAAAPTGGEFVTVPVQDKTDRYATSQKLVSCLTSADNAQATDTTLSYVAATPQVQAKQVAADPALQPWVAAVAAAKGRTSDDLGTKYPKISQPMWTAVQAALSGSASPQSALTTAQNAAAAATK